MARDLVQDKAPTRAHRGFSRRAQRLLPQGAAQNAIAMIRDVAILCVVFYNTTERGFELCRSRSRSRHRFCR